MIALLKRLKVYYRITELSLSFCNAMQARFYTILLHSVTIEQFRNDNIRMQSQHLCFYLIKFIVLNLVHFQIPHP